jgi:flagellar basal-body rod protein FlgF
MLAMTDAIALLGASLRADAEALRVTSQNIANVQTPGYRGEVSVLEFESAARKAAASIDLLTPTPRVANDFRTGSLQQADGPWNVALQGDGYFVLSTPSGEQVTRRGDFTLDSTGKLVSHDGFAVLGDGGEITPPSGAPTIDSDGTIHVNGQVIDRLRRVTAEPTALVSIDDSNFAPASSSSLTEGGVSTVKQGFLETSNVTPTDELLRLMETMRHFDMAQHFVRGASDMLNNAITTLGRV